MHIGDKTFTDYESLRKSFTEGKIPENDLKESLIQAIGSLIKPVREHFENDPEAKKTFRNYSFL
jgi:tyrosyl-tRNA synthetase